MKLKSFLAASALLGAVVACAVAQSGNHLPVGEAAPAFEGTGTDGKAYSLKSLTQEKPAFVVFWKERCPHNPKASSLINSINKAYAGKATLVGVIWTGADGAKKWVEQFSLNYPLLPDADKAVIKSYALKYSIVTMKIGTDGKIAEVFPGYGAEAMGALNKSMAEVAGVPAADVDLTGAPGRLTWG